MTGPSPVTLETIRLVARRLDHLREEVVFLGGAATDLLITSKAIPQMRPTLDVDIIVEIATRSDYYHLEDQLLKLGFKQSPSGDAPLCRWTVDGVIVDIMPTDPAVLGFSNTWYSATIENSTVIPLDENLRIRVAKAPYFLATKIEAFRGRGHGDYLGSHDIEDIVSVIDGREELVDEIRAQPRDIRSFLSQAFEQFREDESFIESLPGHLLPDEASQARRSIILERIDRIVESG